MTLNIEPKEVFSWFYKLNQIPRCSGNEKAVSDFLVDFAKERNLDFIQDEENNVIIKKPAAPGYENSDPVIIQGHMDMVCVKAEGSNHNFDTDPIEMIVEDDILRAKDTTLGGDNGIAVAYALAILDGDYKHAPLEVLVTTNEETGMDGAANIKEGQLKGKKLLNIDSEEEGIFLVSCAGGNTVEIKFEKKYEKEAFKGEGLEILVSGLKGGHSGMEIIKQRANANIVLFRLINAANEATDLRIAKASGGIKHNAIPDSAKATIVVKEKDKAVKAIEELAQLIKKEYEVEDSGLNVEIKEADFEKTFTKPLTEELIDFFNIIPDGVVAVSKSIKNLVQTSLNNAVLYEDDKDIILETSIRSSLDSEIDKVRISLEKAAKRCHGKLEETNRYPAWEFEAESDLREKSLQVYKDLFGEEAVYDAIHAGLECGILKKVMKDTDMISYGPNMWDVHSPKERMSIKSVKKMFDFTVKLLEELK